MNAHAHQKTIFLTGASSGFGKLLVPRLLSKGHRVIAAIRGGQSRLNEIFPTHSNLLGVELHVEKADSIEQAVQWYGQNVGDRLDVLINNAGYGLLGPMICHTQEEIRAQFEVNFFGPVLLTQQLLPFLKSARGRVINISSLAGRATFPFYGSYCASKYALEAFSESLYYDVTPHGVSVCLIEPGGFKTNFTAKVELGKKTKAPDSPYRDRALLFDQFLRSKADRFTKDPILVVKTIERAIEKNRIPFRIPVGSDAVMLSWAIRLIPDFIRMWFIRKGYDLVIFKA